MPTTLPGLQEPRKPCIVPGLERAGTLSLHQQATTFQGLQEPLGPRIWEGGLGTLCAQHRPIEALGQAWPRALVPLETAKSRFSVLFRLFWPF